MFSLQVFAVARCGEIGQVVRAAVFKARVFAGKWVSDRLEMEIESI